MSNAARAALVGLASLALQSPAAANIVRLDERLELVAAGSCDSTPSVLVAGRLLRVDGANLLAEDGSIVESAPETVLDRKAHPGVDVLLTVDALYVAGTAGPVRHELGVHVTGGRILLAAPEAVAVLVRLPSESLILTWTGEKRELAFVGGPEFRDARALGDRGAFVLGFSDGVALLSPDGRMTTILPLEDRRLTQLAVTADGAILVELEGVLLKMLPDGKAYSLLAGRGSLAEVGPELYWCDAELGQRYHLAGLARIGDAVEDRAYARALLTEAHRLVTLGARQEARLIYRKLLELMPGNERVRALLLSLDGAP